MSSVRTIDSFGNQSIACFHPMCRSQLFQIDSGMNYSTIIENGSSFHIIDVGWRNLNVIENQNQTIFFSNARLGNVWLCNNCGRRLTTNGEGDVVTQGREEGIIILRQDRTNIVIGN